MEETEENVSVIEVSCSNKVKTNLERITMYKRPFLHMLRHPTCSANHRAGHYSQLELFIAARMAHHGAEDRLIGQPRPSSPGVIWLPLYPSIKPMWVCHHSC